ncbi:MAG: protein kinase [Planctomycetota bacterium]
MLDDDRKNRLMELFAEASELADTDRGAFLARLAAEDPAVREELLELLQVADRDLADFLTRPVIETATSGSSPAPEIAGYVDLEPIGSGGMSTVYRATQLVPVRRQVAIKTLRTGLDSRQLLARFAAERQALARMAHPNIAAVYDAGADQFGRPWLAMEFVDGVAITDYCNQHALDVDARVELMARVCDAIDHAHRRGVLHRDLKPSNVMVVHDEQQPIPKLIDFGIAKALEGQLGDEPIHTLDGMLLGTPEYMSPEQIAGDGRAVDTRSDVYALGVMLYELVAGERPFDSERLRSAGLTDLLRIVRDEVPPKPSTRLRSRAATASRDTTTHWTVRVRGDLDWVVMKALDKAADRRYPTPRALADDLRRFLANLPVEAGPPSRAYRLRKFVRRYRVLVASSLLVLLSLVGGLVGVTLLAARNEQLATSERQARTEIEFVNDELRHNLYRSQMRLAAEAMQAPGGVARTRELLGAWLPATSESDLRGFEWFLLQASCNRERHVAAAEGRLIQLIWTDDDRLLSTHWRATNAWTSDTGAHLARWESPIVPVAAVAVDGAGSVLAMSTTPTEVTLRSLVTGEPLTVLRHEQPAYRAILSRDGSVVLTMSHPAEVGVWDARSGIHLADVPGGINGAMAVADDGSMVAVGSGQRDDHPLSVFRRDDLEHVLVELSAEAAGAWFLDFSDDGRHLAAAFNDGNLCVWSLPDGALEHHSEHPDGLRCVAFDPSGRRVAAGCQDYVTYVHDMAGGEVRQLSGHTGVVNAVTWSRDGSQLVTLADDATLRWWEVDARPSHRTRQVQPHESMDAAQMTFRADGEELAVRASSLGHLVWRLDDDTTQAGATITPTGGQPPNHDFAATAPDGTLALIARSPQALWLWPAGAAAPTEHHHPQWVRGIAWTHDGQLATIDGADSCRLLDGTDGRELEVHPVPEGPLGIAAHPTEDLIAIACADQSIRLLRATGAEVGRLRGHTGHAHAVAFSPDGQRLASGGRDGTVRLWDVAARAEVASLRAGGKVMAVAFSPDGSRLAAFAANGKIDVWDAPRREGR